MSADNTVSLKEHILVLMAEHNKQHDLLQKALEKAEKELKGKQEDANEWRATVGDFRKETISKDVCETTRGIIDARIKQLETSKSFLEGKASQQSVMIGYIISFIAVLLSLISLVMKLKQ